MQNSVSAGVAFILNHTISIRTSEERCATEWYLYILERLNVAMAAIGTFCYVILYKHLGSHI
jgi:hypothetical protein